MLKEKLGLCPYGVICDEKEFILMPETQYDAEQLKKENKESPKESMKIKSSEESTKEPMEIKSSEEDENTTDWFDRNKFKKVLVIIDSSKFNHKNKMGKFKYNDIKDLVNNIRNNTISEIQAKKDLNALNEIKKAEIKSERLIPTQKELLNSFDDLLETISNNNRNSNNSNNSNVNNNMHREITAFLQRV